MFNFKHLENSSTVVSDSYITDVINKHLKTKKRKWSEKWTKWWRKRCESMDLIPCRDQRDLMRFWRCSKLLDMLQLHSFIYREKSVSKTVMAREGECAREGERERERCNRFECGRLGRIVVRRRCQGSDLQATLWSVRVSRAFHWITLLCTK
jgi:hypothetical protein